MSNLDLLINHYGGMTMSVEQLADLLHMKAKSILNAISADRFPIPTYKAGRIRLANVVDVAAYMDCHSTGV